MTHDEKVNYLRLALSLQKISVTNEIADRVITTYQKILEKKGKFNIEDAVAIECMLDKKYAEERLKEK